jgi:nitric oxide reductase subunit B
MPQHDSDPDQLPLSPWWRRAVVIVMICGFGLLGLVTVKTYQGAPPIPATVVDATGQRLFTADDIEHGQDVFLKYALMEHGTLWGHGAYLGPDYSAEYLHRTVEIGRDTLARAKYGMDFRALDEPPAPGDRRSAQAESLRSGHGNTSVHD